jgi:hypothetical protein
LRIRLGAETLTTSVFQRSREKSEVILDCPPYKTQQKIVDTLANRIETTDDPEISWQLALTLGKLDPEHLKGAVAQTTNIEFSDDDWFELFLGLRLNEDELIDVLIQISSATEKTAQEKQNYLSFEFTGALGEFFSIKFSLGDNDLIENFQI